MDDRICKNCRYWNNTDSLLKEVGICEKITSDTPSGATIHNYCNDHKAEFVTPDLFGCNQFKCKEGFEDIGMKWAKFYATFNGNTHEDNASEV